MTSIINKNVIAMTEECTQGSVEGRLNFPQVVQQLTEVGVERYHADLIRGEKTYYLPNGESHTVNDCMMLEKSAKNFSSDKIKEAIKLVQAASISYKEFCQQIANAGCVDYFVYLNGRQAIYFGRNGDSHTELFPSIK